jgi:hypothetical protein
MNSSGCKAILRHFLYLWIRKNFKEDARFSLISRLIQLAKQLSVTLNITMPTKVDIFVGKIFSNYLICFFPISAVSSTIHYHSRRQLFSFLSAGEAEK